MNILNTGANSTPKDIERRILGKTGLEVTVLGLGSGGNSRLGLSLGKTEDHAISVAKAGLEMGITMFDTANAYQTERAIGQALRGAVRERVVISSKHGYRDRQGELLTAQAFEQGINESLQSLSVDTIDIYFIHGLRRQHYETAVERYVPVFEKARQAGKTRLLRSTCRGTACISCPNRTDTARYGQSCDPCE